jgi:DNA-binding NtrC family response regulator
LFSLTALLGLIERQARHGHTQAAYLAQAATPFEDAMGAIQQDRQTILVVDDEAEVRDSTALLLETLDYVVLEAQDARTAIAVLEQDETIDLMLTDLVLPGGVSGAQLARQALAKRPDLKILLTTGRPELVEGEEFTIIEKPFRMAALAEKIRQTMAAGTA